MLFELDDGCRAGLFDLVYASALAPSLRGIGWCTLKLLTPGRHPGPGYDPHRVEAVGALVLVGITVLVIALA